VARLSVRGAGRRRTPAPERLVTAVALAQGGYFALTGLWPLVSMRTFERVTGPKVDRWLVQTVGVLVLAVGASLGLAGARRRVTPELTLLAAGSAAGLAAIDVVYVARRRIAPVYLLDALTEGALLVGWAAGWVVRRRTGADGRR
jgi:hypothetical protein